VLSSVLDILCPGVAAPWLTYVSRLFDIITDEVIVIVFHPWLFENLEQLATLSGIVSKTEVICWLSHDCLRLTSIASLQSKKLCDCTLPFCRKHTI
jgi:hypothetical protein